jgi:hypothetical protein
MIWRRSILAAMMLAGAAALAGGATQAAAQQFSADFVSNRGQPSPGDAHPKKVFVSGGKVRMEGVGPRGGALLADAKSNTTLMLMPQQKIYMDMAKMGDMIRVFMPVDPDNPCPQWQKMGEDMRPNNPGEDGNWTCRRIGPETVNGRSTIKYQATSPKGEQVSGWIDIKLKVLIKSESAKGHGMELQNIQEGPQQASLFEVPADYRKMDMGQMLQQMMPKGGKPPG